MPRRPCLALSLLLALGGSLHGGIGLAGSDDAPGSTASRSPTAIGLEELMGRLAQSGGVRARFRETKHLSLLTAPLVSEGTLHFAPPDRFARHTTHPGNASIVVDGDRMAMRDETGHRVVDLEGSRVARHFVDNLRVLMRGDLAGLRSRYEIGFHADGTHWQLRLEPRSRVVRRIVEQVSVEGRGAELISMENLETNGDRISTVFFEVETGLDFSPTEHERLFSLEAPDDPQ